MTEKEFKSYLEEIKPHIVISGGYADKSKQEVKDFIKFYKKLTGKIIGEGTCKDCILDAYFHLSLLTQKQIEIMLSQRKYKLKQTKVVFFKGSHYTQANVTDAIAFEMVAFNRSNAANFENPDQLLQDYDLSNSQTISELGNTKKTEKKTEGDGKTVTVTEKTQTKKDEGEKAKMSIDELKVEYEKQKGKKPHWKWDYDTIVKKLNEN